MIKELTLPNGGKIQQRFFVDLAYVIQADDDSRVVKVGRSRTPDRRVAGLISGVPFRSKLIAVLGNGARREREMKALLAPHKLHGEWFAPSDALNSYLKTTHFENELFVKRKTDEPFFLGFIRPAILEYLNGRQPSFSENGDFVYRVLQCGYPAIEGRHGRLLEACPGVLSPELIEGYVPLGVDDALPQIRLRESTDVEQSA